MSGLQRRRVNRSESNNDLTKSDSIETEKKNSTFHKNNNDDDDDDEVNNITKRVAYDPEEAKLRDDHSIPKLTLMEEVLLMGLRDNEGYLSFWNDNISYALRVCIIMELALRNKIRMVDDSARKRFDLSERLIEVIDSSKTGEVLLDETLQLMKNDEPLTIANWIDLLSGETWNLLKINYQLKQVRERLAKGLVDKGVLRTEMKNFFLFDMATHPLSDASCKEFIKRRILATLVSRNMELNYSDYFTEQTTFKFVRTVCLICSTFGANVLENVLESLDYEQRDDALVRAEEILDQFSQYPFDLTKKSSLNVSQNLNQEIQNEIESTSGHSLQLEIIAGCIEVLSRMDMLL